ncbi:Mechanosensitive ion channel [Andreprevotia lacus DSM 23236]|jgi:small-conductance mechanosensitive channel|uniref:Small-conductance mechanosensitive channel n=1 Tax=Andreprevotia lacus DSM 23236 TaxID=1121001 RepID=A0A1W1XE16_9NEIS|nr:mechanosensitive ion channel domain-containing protein [Andreprevotia lacus]SMC22092.1 Mechanosensitive ion channel [Andreprevotia lacus DSM 23236]
MLSGRILRIYLLLVALLPALSSGAVPAANPASAAATLSFLNRPIATFHAELAGASPKVRVQRATDVLERLPERELSQPLDHMDVMFGNQPVTVFRLGDRLLFSLLPGDLAPGDQRSYAALVNDTQAALRVALDAHKQQIHWPNLLRGLGYAILATLGLCFAAWCLNQLRSRLLAGVQTTLEKHALNRSSKGFDWTGSAYQLARRIVEVGTVMAFLALGYLWLVLILECFPITQPLGERLGNFLLGLLGRIAEGFLDAIPGLITVAVILLITRALQDLLGNLFDAVQQNRVTIPGIHADTVSATRRVVAVLVWALALTFAYPYIPGSQSDVFKGLSVLLGLMVTLGSAGLVNQLMSGMVLVYSRALRKGDLVSVGDTVGVVTELSTLSIKLVNLRNEEITLPNAVVVGNTIRNYTRTAGPQGPMLSTTVTIGYDTPWRQVHAMLTAAAHKTAGLVQQPAPYVLQRALSDFYVEYELFAHIPNPLDRAIVLSDLHANIQDEFNAAGVQIMSPHFENQPHQAVYVPRDQWFAPPAHTETPRSDHSR